MKKREAIQDQGNCHVINKSGARAPFTATYLFEKEEQEKRGTETWYLFEKEEKEKRGTESKKRVLKKEKKLDIYSILHMFLIFYKILWT